LAALSRDLTKNLLGPSALILPYEFDIPIDKQSAFLGWSGWPLLSDARAIFRICLIHPSGTMPWVPSSASFSAWLP
jgi:hypothetical protein